jgi:hypothetical protein
MGTFSSVEIFIARTTRSPNVAVFIGQKVSPVIIWGRLKDDLRTAVSSEALAVQRFLSQLMKKMK